MRIEQKAIKIHVDKEATHITCNTELIIPQSIFDYVCKSLRRISYAEIVDGCMCGFKINKSTASLIVHQIDNENGGF